MTISRFLGHRLVRHALGWLVVVLLFDLLVQQRASPALRDLGRQYVVGLLSVLAGVIYLHDGLLTHLLERRRYALYGAATLALVLASAGGLLLLPHEGALQLVYIKVEEAAYQEVARWGEAVVTVAFALVLATFARSVHRGVASHFQLQQLRALQLETELSLLKAQVNQHFLFNTLNNLYGLSLAAPNQIPEALLQLADLMRYQLDSSRQRTVTVGTEAEYLANYIGLEKLRLRGNTHVEFTVDLPHPEQLLAPLLLLPLVENCFKHAIGPSGENTIRIHLIQTDRGLTLRTGNTIPPQYRPAPSGLGLPTLRQRLAQYYPGERHRLRVEATDTFYAASLHLVF